MKERTFMDIHPLASRALAHFDALFPEDRGPVASAAPMDSGEKAGGNSFDNVWLPNTISNMLISPSGPAVDLFCGCGGIAEGLRLAGYEVRAGVDVERKYIATFKHNFPGAHAVTESLLEIEPHQFAQRIGLEAEQLSILVGGPPCQGFSKNVPRKYRYLEDPRNLLVKRYLDYVEVLRPEIVLMENVAEMKNGFEGQYTDEVLERLNSAGYSVTHCVLNAADYGVPQRRRRAFFMGNRAGLTFQVPRPTHSQRSEPSLFSFEEQHVRVWDAIGDLPALNHGEAYEGSYPSEPQSRYQKRARSGSKGIKNHTARHLQPTQLARLKALLPGQGNKDLPPELRSRGGYSGAYGRLTKEMIAPTITRWVFHPGSGRWGHPVDERVLSIREVARIQGFPDTFEFVGSYLEQAGQLGNAVPPLLAATVVTNLRNQLQAYSCSSMSRSLSNESFLSEEGRAKRIA
jgi:DNA (cytosine-5)-methyltransferase 1